MYRLMRLAFGAALALNVFAVSSDGARAETLADALVHAYENSGLLDQNRALLRAADEDVGIALSALAPIISWSNTYTLTNASTGGGTDFDASNALTFSAQLLLYDAGATQTLVEIQKELVLSTRQTLLAIEQQVLFRVVQAYMDVRSTSEFVALRENNVLLITQEFRAAQDRFEVGEVTRTDVSTAEARLASARSLLASAQGDLVQAAAEFHAAVGRAPGNLEPPSARLDLLRTYEEARAVALRNHPEIIGAQHDVAAAELSILRAGSAMRPTARANAGITFDSEFDTTESIGVTISGPIYAGGQLSAQYRQAQARRDAARAGLHVVRQNIEQRVSNAFAILSTSIASSEASERQIRASRVAFRGVREEATLGARTTLDVLNAEQELLDAQANLISAQASQVVAAYNVLASMGLLTAEDLNLGVQMYDPAAYYNLVKDAPTYTSDQGRALDRVLRAIGNE